MDADLRNSLWNAIYGRFQPQPKHWIAAGGLLAKYLFKLPVDTLPTDAESRRDWIRAKFFEASWHESYDIIEYLVDRVDHIKRPLAIDPGYRTYREQKIEFTVEVNHILERELAGYRFVNSVLAPITDASEVDAIETASLHVRQGSLSGPSTHIRAALTLLGQKPTPDYRNSIKESISAVEAAVSLLAGTSAGGVSKAVELLASKIEIHPALRAAIKNLYGFSSDADGVRHAILEQSSLGFAEAKFMLVVCSAFVNFLQESATKAGLARDV
jgi:hypothetical protein